MIGSAAFSVLFVIALSGIVAWFIYCFKPSARFIPRAIELYLQLK